MYAKKTLASCCKVIHMRKQYQRMSHADIPSIQKQPEVKEKEEQEWKEGERIIKCINYITAHNWANILLQQRINVILNITT
jgi:hypothetical protein